MKKVKLKKLTDEEIEAIVDINIEDNLQEDNEDDAILPHKRSVIVGVIIIIFTIILIFGSSSCGVSKKSQEIDAVKRENAELNSKITEQQKVIARLQDLLDDCTSGN